MGVGVPEGAREPLQGRGEWLAVCVGHGGGHVRHRGRGMADPGGPGGHHDPAIGIEAVMRHGAIRPVTGQTAVAIWFCGRQSSTSTGAPRSSSTPASRTARASRTTSWASPARVALAGEHADQAPSGHRGLEPRHRRHPAGDQLARPGPLVVAVDLGQRHAGGLLVDPLAAQLVGERPAAEPLVAVPRGDPLLGEVGVVDQPDLDEPVEHPPDHVVVEPAACEVAGQLGPGPRPRGEQVQAHRAGGGDRVGRVVAGPVSRPASSGFGDARERAGRRRPRLPTG